MYSYQKHMNRGGETVVSMQNKQKNLIKKMNEQLLWIN